MSRMRLVLPILAAVLAVSAVASASAMAAAPRYVIEGKEVKGTEKFAITAGVGIANLNSVVGGLKMDIECVNNKVTGENFIEGEGKSKGETALEGCTLYEVAKNGALENKSEKCLVKTPIVLKYADQLVIGPGGLPEDELKPASGEIFVEVVIQNAPGHTCLIAANLQVKGAYAAAIGPEAEVERREHELRFTSAGSKINIGALQASFTNRINGLKLKKFEGETLSKKFRILTE
jgi:hypothetical protein